MIKLIPIFFILFLFSCNKEDLNDNQSNNSNPPTASTITVSYSSFVYQLYYCRFTYYDITGLYHFNETHMDKQVENVDFSRDFKVEAQCGITMYDPINGPIYNPQYTDWQVKKDGVVMDARGATSYIYQN